MAKKSEFVQFILDQLIPLGDVHARSMFGGHGIYHAGIMFAIIIEGELYFKADEVTRDEFIDRGLEPFTYTARGKSIALQYYAAPPEVFDEAEAMLHWAKQAIATAARANRSSKPASKTPRPRLR